MNTPNELDRYELATPGFPTWLQRWCARWYGGERIRVLIALDETHAIVVADPTARQPSSVIPRPVQLELNL